MAYYLKDLSFTEEGKKLKLSDEDRERFRLVYKREGDGWILHDIYEKGGEYGDDCIVVPLQSTYIGTDFFGVGEIFKNVIGSTGDSKPVGKSISWIDLWRCIYLVKENEMPPKNCCTDGNVYEQSDVIVRSLGCNVISDMDDYLQGGHVVKGNDSTIPKQGATVYIAPICISHNNGVAVNQYMKTRQQTFVVKLRYKVKPRTYLAQHPLETHEKI